MMTLNKRRNSTKAVDSGLDWGRRSFINGVLATAVFPILSYSPNSNAGLPIVGRIAWKLISRLVRKKGTKKAVKNASKKVSRRKGFTSTAAGSSGLATGSAYAKNNQYSYRKPRGTSFYRQMQNVLDLYDLAKNINALDISVVRDVQKFHPEIILFNVKQQGVMKGQEYTNLIEVKGKAIAGVGKPISGNMSVICQSTDRWNAKKELIFGAPITLLPGKEEVFSAEVNSFISSGMKIMRVELNYQSHLVRFEEKRVLIVDESKVTFNV